MPEGAEMVMPGDNINMVCRRGIKTRGSNEAAEEVLEENGSMVINPSCCYRPRDEFATPPTMARN